jgi:hypothetical protein
MIIPSGTSSSDYCHFGYFTKLTKKIKYCPAQSSGCPNFLKKNKNDGVIPSSAVWACPQCWPLFISWWNFAKKRI